MITPSLAERITAIERCRPSLAQDIRTILAEEGPSVDPGEDAEFQPARRGGLTFRLDGRYVHSRIAPLEEAKKRIRGIGDHGKQDGIVTVGLGLGYLIEAIRSSEHSGVTTTVVSVVFSHFLLEKVLTHRTVDWWCRNGPDRLVPAWFPNVIPVILREMRVFDPLVLPLEAYAGPWPELFTKIRDVLHHTKERNSVNRHTLRRFGTLWVRNTLRNIAICGALPGIDTLAGTFPDVPALVCGAGPTLDDLEPHIAQLAQRHLIIAVDTALPVFQRWGIVPHFAVVSDPQYWNTRHLDRVTLAGTILVAEPATHPRVFRLWRGDAFVSASLFPLGNFFDRRLGRKLKLGAGGSVATSAWDLARILGSRDIALAGIDLSFPDFRTHCDDSFFENLLQRQASRLSPAEHGMARYLHSADPRRVSAAGGGDVVSDRRMEVYRSWFAEQASVHSDVTTCLLSGKSSAIEGVSVETPADRIHRLRPISISTQTVSNITPRPADGTEDGMSLLRELVGEIESIYRIVQTGITVCDTLAQQDRPELESPDAIDQQLFAIDSHEAMGFLATDLLEAEAHTSASSVEEAIAQSRRIYSAIAEPCTYHLEYLRRLLEDM